jgi:hypothetical protein
MRCSITCTAMDAGWIEKMPVTLSMSTWPRVKAPVPRHGEIDNRLATKICAQLGIPPI